MRSRAPRKTGSPRALLTKKRWHDAVAARPAVRTGNAVRLDLQQVGVQSLSETERKSLYSRRF